MDITYILIIGAVLFLGYKLLFAKKADGTTNAGALDKVIQDRLTGLEKVTNAENANTTVDLVTKWQAARKTAADAKCEDAVKAFDDAFKLLNAEGTK